jgi:hypothetical protein
LIASVEAGNAQVEQARLAQQAFFFVGVAAFAVAAGGAF